MWIEIHKENSLQAAKKWKATIEEGGIPCRLLPPKGAEDGVYSVLVPRDKDHLVQEMLRRI